MYTASVIYLNPLTAIRAQNLIPHTINYARNIPLLYFYSIFIKRISMPIIVLYFLFNNLSFTEIGTLAAVTSIIHMATEIHGGIFADINGKKTSLMLHAIFGILTMFFYYIGDSFSWFLIASLMYGIAGAFITGTRNSLLYDSLNQLKRSQEFKKYNGKIMLYSHVVNAALLLGVPLLYTYNNKFPFLIGILFFLIAFILSLFFVEPPINKSAKDQKGIYTKKLLAALKEIHLSKQLTSSIFLSVVTVAFIFMSSEFIQPLLQISSLPIIYFGVIYAIMRVLAGLGGALTHKLEQYIKVERLLGLGLLGIICSFVGFAYGTGLGIVLAVLLLNFSEGTNRVILEDEINQNIQSDNRTTVLSITSLSQVLLRAILVFAFGILADKAGVQGMFSYAIGLLVITSLGTLFYYYSHKKS